MVKTQSKAVKKTATKVATPARPVEAAKRPTPAHTRSGPAKAAIPSAKQTAGRTKQEIILKLLRGFKGATIAELAAATAWQPHSVRGFLAGTVKGKLKLNLVSEKKDGDRRYRLLHRAG